MTHDVYIYGMTLLSTLHRLRGAFPTSDGYQEIAETHVVPGGEGANGAVVLQRLGLSTVLEGPWLGGETAAPIRTYLGARGVDCGLLRERDDFPGWRDIVFCDGDGRTVFGWFQQYFEDGSERWSAPTKTAIATAKCAAIDPYFKGASEGAAALCLSHGVPYVTIDCGWDTEMARNARAVVCSKAFVDAHYPGEAPSVVFDAYRKRCNGLIVFTFGRFGVWYGDFTHRRCAQPAFEVEVNDTLAAGDAFRAGMVFGLMKGMGDGEAVRFSSALAALVCTRFPSVLHPPSLDEVSALLGKAAE